MAGDSPLASRGGRTKAKLARGEPALGGWMMIGHPAVAELMAGEGFDWIAVDMEHTAIDLGTFQTIAMALRGSPCDLLVRLPACDPVIAKRVLDLGAGGIIVPMVNTAEEAALAVSMARFPPAGIRGASFARATDYGRDFDPYFAAHNERVLVVVMLEHIRAAEAADAILATPGIDAALIGPYDLSASMGIAGHVDRPEVLEAERRILEACRRAGVAPGIHVVPIDPEAVGRRIREGFRFIGCGIDSHFVIEGARRMLKARLTP
ncbi:MAG: 2,4-dihydroxyhept-2-ene-1,7-dioic acid aldolase [Planctomycetes bacterium]|nr:2,4-dihydroxyhept-2-ene-1,7-dioic acid aldolase [Planctomycetota bacterium]